MVLLNGSNRLLARFAMGLTAMKTMTITFPGYGGHNEVVIKRETLNSGILWRPTKPNAVFSATWKKSKRLIALGSGMEAFRCMVFWFILGCHQGNRCRCGKRESH